MALINVSNLEKVYKINKRNKGILGAVKSLLIPEYEIKKAINNIDFSINQGETVGFVGPNGAGKSTTVKILTGILVQDKGEVWIDGLAPYKDRKKYTNRIGVVFGQRTQLWWDLPIADTFDLLKHVYNIPEGTFRQNMEKFNELLGLNEFMKQAVRQLSLGQRMRADLAAALLHNPKIIFLDEPTIGLDVVAKDKILDFIRYINKENGVTVLFTSHNIKDIERTCEKIMIIDKGKLIYNGSMESIRKKYGDEKIVTVEYEGRNGNLDINGAVVVRSANNKVWIKLDKKLLKESDLVSAINRHYQVNDLSIQEPDIEEIMKSIYLDGIKEGYGYAQQIS